MSSLIPQHIIDDANSDIVEVVRGYVPGLKKSGKNWSACCPFHSEKSPSFTVSEGKEMFYCFGCGASGNAVGFVMQISGMNFRDAVTSIVGNVQLETANMNPIKKVIRALKVDMPGHAEDRARTKEILDKCKRANQHMYLAINNTAPNKECLTLKNSLVVSMVNEIGEEVNAAAITTDGIKFAAGKPSYGSAAILEPEGDHDGRTIMCIDYAHAWRIWWAQRGKSRVLACLDHDNFRFMLLSRKERFTHVGCDPAEADEHIDMGRAIVAVPLDPYAKLDMSILRA